MIMLRNVCNLSHCGSLPMPALSLSTPRGLHTSFPLLTKNIRTGVPKITTNRSKPLTYEQSQKPHQIGVTKYWNSINTSGLHIEKEYEKSLPRSSETATEDAYIRKFITGTYQHLLLGEPVIKRRGNLIVIAFLVKSLINVKPLYFLKGYTETILPRILKCPVKVEVQTVADPKSIIFKHI